LVQVKICGFTRTSDVKAAVDAGANYLGFVFCDHSPRKISASKATEMGLIVPPGLIKVGLFINPETVFLENIMNQTPLDMIQLHGAESPERVEEIKALTGLPVMKAVAIATKIDVETLKTYEDVADQILCDTKPPPSAKAAGGNGLSFDWSLLSGYRWEKPWMLAGGLNVNTVQKAIGVTNTQQVDVSSGVEYKPGLKNPEKIKAFIAAAKA